MTRRERLERKLEKRQDWAAGAAAKSTARMDRGREMASVIPLGQPILIGHHSEKRDRAYRGRIAGNFDKAMELDKLAKHHTQRASGLEAQLESSIFSDDADALDRLREKAAQLEAEREAMKAANVAWKKKGRAGVVELLGEEQADKAFYRAGLSGSERPYPAYKLTNTGAEIRRCRVRIASIEAERRRAAEAESLGGLKVTRAPTANWCTVTFAEKPDRAVLAALREAGYSWGRGSWCGYLDKLPAVVEELDREARAECSEAAE